MIKHNDLYIGYENFGLEHGDVKHPATIEHYNIINRNKLRDKPIELMGLDLETNCKTGKLKLLGFFDIVDGKEVYDYYYNTDFVSVLFRKVRECEKDGKAIAHWNKLDPFICFKQFLLRAKPEERTRAIENFGKISGDYNQKDEEWNEEPIIKVDFMGVEFGILNVIRSSIQFYFKKKNSVILNRVWAYDIANLYPNGLAVEGKRFPYYSKLDKEVHLIDADGWLRYEWDKSFQEKVLTSNYLDSKVCRDLGYLAQENFKKVFRYYASNLLSYGSFTRSGIVASITNKHKDAGLTGKELDKAIMDDLNAIPIKSHIDRWTNQYGEELVKELLCISIESYSGGYIEGLGFGFSQTAFMSDIANAYPSIAVKLYDLRGSELIKGTGIPPKIPHSYCFIRGDVKTPLTLNFNPIAIKHPFSNITNIRGVGEYRASYLLETRELLTKYGVHFSNEEWIIVKTKGIISPFALAIQDFLTQRYYFRKLKDSAEETAKGCANSGYGITIECTPIYKRIAGEVKKIGFRGGEFFNGIYATVITAFTRNFMTDACLKIELNGGKVVQIMTDSAFWLGKITDLPPEFWREEKTVGYFEKPIEVKNFMSLGTGRYEYDKMDETHVGKTRGFSMEDLNEEESKNGIEVEKFNWRLLTKRAIKEKTSLLTVNSRILISPSLVLHNKDFTLNDIGLVKRIPKKIDLISGKYKRIVDLSGDWLSKLADTMIFSKPLKIGRGMDGTNTLPDFTLPNFRKAVMEKHLTTNEEKDKVYQKTANQNYYQKNRTTIREVYQAKYQELLKYGIEPKLAGKFANLQWKKIYEIIGGNTDEIFNGKVKRNQKGETRGQGTIHSRVFDGKPDGIYRYTN